MTQDTKQMTGSNFDFAEFQKQAIERLKKGQPLMGTEGIITPLIKQIIEASLEGELEAHLESCSNSEIANRRNGKSRKTLKTADGSFELETPRDREGSFEPQLVKKRQTILNESLDNKITGLYRLGMSYQDIDAHLQEMYGVEVSP